MKHHELRTKKFHNIDPMYQFYKHFMHATYGRTKWFVKTGRVMDDIQLILLGS
jgi:hypothetical protein